ncbi:MAG: hypothetical protein WEE89_14860 [Gemmatimonadota bacterium]
MNGTLQTPYAVRDCALNSEADGGGAVLHAGVGVRAFSITAGYMSVHADGSSRVCFPADERPDGVYQVREFRATHSGIWGWAFNLRYAPPSLPTMIYAGTGIRFGGNELGHNQFVSLGAGLRTRGSLSLFAGGEITQLRTHFVRLDQEYRNGSVISSTEVRRGRGWRKMQMLRFGLEYQWTILK